MTYHVVPLGAELADRSAPARAVFLHGYACSSQDWMQVAHELGPGRDLLVDFPAHGTAATAPAMGFASLVESTAALLAQLPAPPALLGHSMGGMVAMAVAWSHPHLISGLVLADAFPYLPAVIEVFGGAEDDDDPFGYGSVIDRQTPIEVQARVRASMEAGVRTAPAKLHAELMGLDLRAELSEIAVPTLVLIGDRHGVPPLSAVELSRALGMSGLPNATVQLVPSHHFIMLEQPQTVARHIEKFFLDQEITPKGKK